MRILAEQLDQPEEDARDDRVGTFRRTLWVKLQGWVTSARNGWRDSAAHAQPAGPIPGRRLGEWVSGTASPGMPINLSAVDLSLKAWPGSRGPNARGALGKDDSQVGELSLATTLDTWVRDWITVRDLREHQPEPTVDVMTRWLADRANWACDVHEEIADFATDINAYRSALRAVLGLTNRDDYKRGVPCPKCHSLTLVRRNGGDWVECDSCPVMLSPTEYAEHTKTAAGKARDTPEAAV